MPRMGQRGDSSVTLPCVVFTRPRASCATAVAVAFRRFLLRSAFSFALPSLTPTFLVLAGAILKVALRPSSVSPPRHEPAALAGHVTFTAAPPFLDARTVCFGTVPPGNCGEGAGVGAATSALAVAV